MSTSLCAVKSLVLLVAFAASAFGQAPDTSESVFGMKNVLDVHLQFTPDEWEKLQPPDDVIVDFGVALEGLMEDAIAQRNFHSEKSSRPGIAGYVGIDHQYGLADVTIGEETISKVGVRYKGNGTFFGGHPLGKFSFKIDFNEYNDALEFRGLTKVNLNSNVNDPSMLREALSYELFREAGVPASRTGWARLYLTVANQTDSSRTNSSETGPTETDHKYLGLYLVVEQVDKRFLKRVYGSSKGLLVKPSTFGAFRYFGDDWEKYKAAYFPKTDPSPEQKQRLIDFARLIHRTGDGEFAATIEEYLDMDEFLSFLAVNVILSNLDSFLGGSQNYYAYLEPTTNKFQLLPWDLDISFGAFGMLGTPVSRRNLSIDRPQVGKGSNRLIERVLAIPKYKVAHRDRVKQLMDTMFDEEKMRSQITEVADFVRPLVGKDGDRAIRRFEADLKESPEAEFPQPLKFFVRKRRESVLDQLAGKSAGEHLAWDGSEMPAKLIAKLFACGAAILFAGSLNAIAWLWALIAGFRDSNRWGLLNMVLYPFTPLVYGFQRRKDLGRGAAIMTLCSIGLMIAVIGAIRLLW